MTGHLLKVREWRCHRTGTHGSDVNRILAVIHITGNLLHGLEHAVTQFLKVGNEYILNIVLGVCKLCTE